MPPQRRLRQSMASRGRSGVDAQSRRPEESGTESRDVEVVELGHIGPPRHWPGPRPLLAGGVVILAGIIIVAGLPAGLTQPTAGTPPPTQTERSQPAVVATATSSVPPGTPFPWTWALAELRGFGRGATVTNVWPIGDTFVAEIETDDGPDGGPYGPVRSVLLTSGDGTRWTNLDVPTDGYTIETGTVVGSRLVVVGWVGATEDRAWQVWSIERGTWQREPDPIGLVGKRERVIEIAIAGECGPDGRCDAGWVAVVGVDGSSEEDLRVSTDGIRWTRPTLPLDDPASLTGIAWRRGTWFVIASYFHRCCSLQVFTDVLASDDRRTWTATHISATNGGGRDLTAGVGGLALVGVIQEAPQEARVPKVWLSGDGVGWLEGPGGVLPGRAPAPMDFVVATDHGYAAMSAATGDAWISTDGEFWRCLPAFNAEQGDTVLALAYANDTLVAGGRSSTGRPTFWSTTLSALLGVP